MAIVTERASATATVAAEAIVVAEASVMAGVRAGLADQADSKVGAAVLRQRR